MPKVFDITKDQDYFPNLTKEHEESEIRAQEEADAEPGKNNK